MLKVNNYHTRLTSLTPFWRFCCKIYTNFTRFSLFCAYQGVGNVCFRKIWRASFSLTTVLILVFLPFYRRYYFSLKETRSKSTIKTRKRSEIFASISEDILHNLELKFELGSNYSMSTIKTLA